MLLLGLDAAIMVVFLAPDVMAKGGGGDDGLYEGWR